MSTLCGVVVNFSLKLGRTLNDLDHFDLFVIGTKRWAVSIKPRAPVLEMIIISVCKF